ncbi:TetR/AcrR family transcriptional regulator [Leifsonia sp. A12D58]|uniref:TetR/AcrR family transcriptional regulator n=1 Tax=Leifsonia sp. A12D58 TaxID=3397674 RepID=UPI0039E133E0
MFHDREKAPMAATGAAELRVDARDNRDRIVTVASDAFAELGTGISMTELAKRAGVGVATLFRRFPTKEALIDAVFSTSVARWHGRLGEAMAEPHAWGALRTIVEEIAAEQARHPACADMLVTSFLHGDGYVAERRSIEAGFSELIRRAQADHQVVADLEWRDFTLLMEANAGVVMAAEGDAADASGRLTNRLLDAFERQAPQP